MNLLFIGSTIACICYLIASVAIVTRLFHPKGPNHTLVLLLGSIALLAHSNNNLQLLFSHNSINFNLPNVISLVSLTIAFIVSVASVRFKVSLLLPVIYLFAGLWQLIMLLLPPIPAIPLVGEPSFLAAHITLALIAYCLLIIATLFAFQVAYINVKLKNKNLIAVSHLPPLMQVEQQLFFILSVGTFCLFCSELSGFLFLEDLLSKERAHKTLLSLLALLTYSVILWGHFRQGWRGHRVLVLTITATSLLTLSYFGSRFVKEFIL